MQRIRVERHNRNFVTLDCTIFRDKRISLKAKGLHALIFQLPPNWDFTVEGIATLSKDGRDATTNTIKELIKFGYMERERKTDDRGRFKGYDYVIYEQPKTNNVLSENGKPENGKTVIGKSNTIKVLNNKSIKELNNIGDFSENPPSPALFDAKEEKEEKQTPSPLPPPPSFNQFWDRYSYKVGKAAAKKIWEKMRPEDKTAAYEGVFNYETVRKENDHPKCHPSTYLRNERWEDELPTKGEQNGYFSKLLQKVKAICPPDRQNDIDFVKSQTKRFLKMTGASEEQAVRDFDRLLKSITHATK